jgi:hypothetical protein
LAYYTSQAPIYGRQFAYNILTAYETRPSGPLAPSCIVHLMNAPPSLQTPDVTLADLEAVEIDFSGYTPQPISLTGPVNSDLQVDGVIANATFIAGTTTPQVTDTAKGYWVQSGSEVVVIEVFPVNQQAPFVNPDDFLTLNLFLPQQCYTATS